MAWLQSGGLILQFARSLKKTPQRSQPLRSITYELQATILPGASTTPCNHQPRQAQANQCHCGRFGYQLNTVNCKAKSTRNVLGSMLIWKKAIVAPPAIAACCAAVRDPVSVTVWLAALYTYPASWFAMFCPLGNP